MTPRDIAVIVSHTRSPSSVREDARADEPLESEGTGSRIGRVPESIRVLAHPRALSSPQISGASVVCAIPRSALKILK